MLSSHRQSSRLLIATRSRCYDVVPIEAGARGSHRHSRQLAARWRCQYNTKINDISGINATRYFRKYVLLTLPSTALLPLRTLIPHQASTAPLPR